MPPYSPASSYRFKPTHLSLFLLTPALASLAIFLFLAGADRAQPLSSSCYSRPWAWPVG